ncbi:MAG: neuromedin U [Desulfofustis sp.]|nr:neuromedin U [Desulfofustis sp.]
MVKDTASRDSILQLKQFYLPSKRAASLFFSVFFFSIFTISFLPTNLSAEDKGADLRSAVQNPISSLISVPFKFTFDFGADNGDAQYLNIQPVVPVSIGDWNIVNRVIIPIGGVDGPITGQANNPSPISGDGAEGLSDINYSAFLSPAKVGKLIWGVGASLSIPSASDDQLGSGKWSAGPTAVLLTQPGWGSVGLLARQLWSFSGDEDRREVSQLLLEPFINYNLENGWFLITDMIITSNWEASSGNEWTLPLGGGIGRVFKIGNQPINSRLEAYYNVERPDGAPEWNLAFTWQFLFPK